MTEIREALSQQDLSIVHDLFEEYAASLAVDLAFQNFKRELAQLPGDYTPPSGRLLIAFHEGLAAGCIALRKVDTRSCEMKRLYVKRSYRGFGLGKLLAERIISEARKIGYERMLLDTLPTMTEARQLYLKLGFQETAPYRFNPVPGTSFMCLHLRETSRQPSE